MTDTKTTRVLVVDDEPSILELLKTALVALGGYDVTTAWSGQDALIAMSKAKPRFDMVLLDIQMPEMNGVEACRQIRAMASYEDVPVIMLTAMSQMDYVEKAFLAGATDYVTKPFNFEDLRNRMVNAFRAVETRRAADAAARETAVKAGLGPHERIKFDAKLDFSQFDRVLETDRFDNYVRQMVGSRAPHTSAFAVKVSNGYYLHRALTNDEFIDTIREVTALLAEATAKMGSLISYRGQGIFLCVEYGNRLSDPEEIEHFLNIQVHGHTDKNIRPKIVVSPHAELKQNDKATARHLISDAISKVELRDSESAAEARSPAPAAAPQGAAAMMRRPIWGLGQPDPANEQRSYRTILSSVLRGS
ncbi:MAG: response regulator [Paracoccaceae bacterium]